MQSNTSKNYDKLISGKNSLERLVNLEIQDDVATLFIENKDGSINQQTAKNKSWVLTHDPIRGAAKLDGSLYYQYGSQYANRKDWYNALQILRKRNSDFFTIYDQKESFLVKDGYTLFKGMTHTEPSILSFDIESTGLFHNADSKVLLISNTLRKNGKVIRKLFAYDDFSTPGEMLTSWCSWVRDCDPSIIAGHNIYSFDFKYLNYIAEQEGVELNLGRDGSALTIAPKPSKFRIDGSRDQEYHKVRCYGREIIDTMFLAIRHDIVAKKYDSYGLKAIIKVEGLEKEDRQFYDSSQIRINYKDQVEWEKIKQYCIHDSDDGLAVYDLCSPASFYLTQSIPKTFQQVVESAPGSQINAMMIRSYLQDGHSIPKTSPTQAFEGAISFGNPGIYRNVHKVDVASLYPSIILECKVYDEDKDPKGNFLKIMEIFTAERLKNKALFKQTKDPYYDYLQNAQKIIINSGYGFMAAPGLNFNSPSASEFITRTGREILTGALDWAKRGNFLVPNADTDSISYCKADQSPITESERLAYLQEINALFPKSISWEDDGYYPTVLILKAKNYVLFDGKKSKIKGSALKASSKSTAMKEMIKRLLDSIIDHKTNQQEIYLEYVKEAAAIKDITRWASRKTISERTLNSERKNETRIKEAIAGTEIVEGDRIWVFNKTADELELVQNFDGNYSLDKMVKSCYDTSLVFENILDTKSLFKNYTLKKNKIELAELIDETSNHCTDRYQNDSRKASCSGSTCSSISSN